MKYQTDIPGYLTPHDAANRLGIAEHRVVELARKSVLDSIRPGRRTLLLEARSVYRLAAAERFAGRPLGLRSAWGILWMLDGLQADWLSPVQKSRVKKRLSELSAAQVVWSVRKRGDRTAFWAEGTLVPRIKESIACTGISAIAVSPKEAYAAHRDFDLVAPMGSNRAIGYLPEREMESIQSRYCLLPAANGNIEILTAEWLPFSIGSALPNSVVAVDLATSLDPRERQAGLQYIEERLEVFR